MSLFQRKPYKMNSGGIARYRIDCEALTDEDFETLAWLIAQKGAIRAVRGISDNGRRLARHLEQFLSEDGVRLIVDDVLTTGGSIEAARKDIGWHDALGVVIFARGPCPRWVLPVFSMEWINTEDEFPSPETRKESLA